MKRKRPIARNTAMKRRPRKAKPGDDRGYREFLARECRCVACAKLPPDSYSHVRPTGIEAAHTVHNGMASKGQDSSCIPLCPMHHAEMDGRLNTRMTTKLAFAEKYGLDLEAESKAHFALYQMLDLEDLNLVIKSMESQIAVAPPDTQRLTWLLGDPEPGASADDMFELVRDCTTIAEAREMIDEMMAPAPETLE